VDFLEMSGDGWRIEFSLKRLCVDAAREAVGAEELLGVMGSAFQVGRGTQSIGKVSGGAGAGVGVVLLLNCDGILALC
jgi:hypothetical protein